MAFETRRALRGSHAPSDLTAVFLRLVSACLLALALLCPAAAQAAAASEKGAPASAVERAAPLEVSDFLLAGDSTRIRIVINFDREPEISWSLLRSPHRFVLDVLDAEFLFDPKDVKPRGLVSGLRYGQFDEGRARLIVHTKGPFDVEEVNVLKNEGSDGYRLVADLVAGTEKSFESALAEQAAATGATTAKTGRLVPVANERKRFTIVVDPGHGGIDGGAEGVSGTVEKDVTLAFAKALRDALQATNAELDVKMTRDDDVFLRLDERVRIARQHGADLLISIHADTIRLSKIRGATIYTLSDKASDDEAAALAARENLADELAGAAVPDENHEVADILMDLIRRETHGFSIRFARTLVGELSEKIELINNPHRFAGFKVLRAPDVPSVLLELGYLSNPRDEALLLDPEWRRKAVEGIAAAVSGFAKGRTAAGGTP